MLDLLPELIGWQPQRLTAIRLITLVVKASIRYRRLYDARIPKPRWPAVTPGM